MKSSYYSDVISKKMREIDVAAHQHWVRDGGIMQQRARFSIIVECKSISGFHIVIDPYEADEDDRHTPFYWLGAESNVNSRLWHFLIDYGLTPEQSFLVIEGLKEWVIDDIFWSIRGLRVAPLVPPVRASAFRETNIGGAKDLSNSVLWRAVSSLGSAIESQIERNTRVHLSWVESGLEKSRGPDGVDPVPLAVEWCARQSDFVDLYYPVVVLDGPLWRLEGEHLEPIDWFRLDKPSPSGFTHEWCDVVNSSYFLKYATLLTEHISTQYANSGAVLESSKP